MPWNLIDHPGLLRWLKIKGKKVLTGPKGTSLHVSADLVWSLAPLGVTRLILCSHAGPQLKLRFLREVRGAQLTVRDARLKTPSSTDSAFCVDVVSYRHSTAPTQYLVSA
jgi:hypothetical protein